MARLKNANLIRDALRNLHARPVIWCTIGNSRVYTPDGARQCGFNRTALSLLGTFRGQINTCGGHATSPYSGNIQGTHAATDFVLSGGFGESAYTVWSNMPTLQRTNVMPLGQKCLQFGPFYVPSGSQTPGHFLCITVVSPGFGGARKPERSPTCGFTPCLFRRRWDSRWSCNQ